MGKSQTRSPRQVRDDVAALVAKRDQLDRDQQRQREREESAFDRYARARLLVTSIERDRDEALAELDQRREHVAATAREQLDAVAAEQCAVLHELHVDGLGRRSAEDLASLFDLPVKRVRSMLRHARAVQVPDPAAGPAQDSPAQSSPDSNAQSTPEEQEPDRPDRATDHDPENPDTTPTAPAA